MDHSDLRAQLRGEGGSHLQRVSSELTAIDSDKDMLESHRSASLSGLLP
jgi:hypothetical protein